MSRHVMLSHLLWLLTLKQQGFPMRLTNSWKHSFYQGDEVSLRSEGNRVDDYCFNFQSDTTHAFYT